MPCDSKDTIKILIDSDRRYIANCRWIYGSVLVVSVGLTLCLEFFLGKTNTLTSLSGLLANGLAFPLVPKHMQRASALKILEGLNQECNRFNPTDPRCQRIADNIDAMLRVRGGI